jgi:ubiquinone/menaquinone biosynthesis C-methylase UbiE
MSESHASFSGSIPEAYDAYLGPLLFEFSAADIAGRVAEAVRGAAHVLEIACGTGISTQFLRQRLPPDARIVATDLNPGMLDFAREHRGALPGVRYELADALALPFEARSFDSVVCQFGIMFFPDVSGGLTEMYRVLRPGGFVACNVWDSLEANRVAGIAHETIARYFDTDPPSFLRVPFESCPLEPTLELFRAQGFEEVQAHVVEAASSRATQASSRFGIGRMPIPRPSFRRSPTSSSRASVRLHFAYRYESSFSPAMRQGESSDKPLAAGRTGLAGGGP